MTAVGFNACHWIEELAQALSGLASAQALYQDDLYQWRRQSVRSEMETIAPHHPSDDLNSFYYHTCLRPGRYFEERYASLRAAYADVRAVLAVHPSWAAFLDAADDRSELWIQIVNSGSLQDLSSMVGGLMARAMEVRENGFRVAATELNALLEPVKDPESMPARDDLTIGYHVALLHGLRVDGEYRIAEDMTLVPFRHMRDFVNQSVLGDVAPNIIKFNGWQSIAAIVKPFRWKPTFAKRGGESGPELDWGSSFFEDAQAFVELLAMFHAEPVVCVVTVPYCIHRTASYLLGRPHYHGSYSWGPTARSLGRFAKSNEISSHALNEATGAFGARTTDQYNNCAPVIGRLAEALARGGRFRTDDQIMDVAIALERMYELDGGEISFKLKTRAACFLEADTEGRLRVFQNVENFYKARSSIVHRRRKPYSVEAKLDAFNKGFEIARRSVVKLLQGGPPSDWNEVVIRAQDLT